MANQANGEPRRQKEVIAFVVVSTPVSFFPLLPNLTPNRIPLRIRLLFNYALTPPDGASIDAAEDGEGEEGDFFVLSGRMIHRRVRERETRARERLIRMTSEVCKCHRKRT